MAATPQVAPTEAPGRPRLILFYSPQSGRCRRAEGFLAQVLQRRHNHDTFQLIRVAAEQRPDLIERFRIAVLPTLVIVEERRVKGRIEMPSGCRELERFLKPWLR